MLVTYSLPAAQAVNASLTISRFEDTTNSDPSMGKRIWANPAVHDGTPMKAGRGRTWSGPASIVCCGRAIGGGAGHSERAMAARSGVARAADFWFLMREHARAGSVTSDGRPTS